MGQATLSLLIRVAAGEDVQIALHSDPGGVELAPMGKLLENRRPNAPRGSAYSRAGTWPAVMLTLACPCMKTGAPNMPTPAWACHQPG